MDIAVTELMERFYGLLWPMLRISALLVAAPIFSLRALNLRIRIVLAMAITWLVYPMHEWPCAPAVVRYTVDAAATCAVDPVTRP